jgi:DNA-binding transcriptional MerR regulator
MIGKINIGKSFSGCIAYCLEDKKLQESQEVAFKNRAEIIQYSHCFGSKKELIEQFNDVRALNPKVQKPVMHIVLSLSPGEQLDKAKLAEMAGECAKEMGFDNNQYLAVSHIDTHHQHLHIIANRIGYDGKVVRDSHNYKKVAGCCRKMELKYQLKQVLSPRMYLSQEQRNIPRLDTRKETLRNTIVECLSASKYYGEFESKIRQKGYQVVKGRGILFIDKQGVKVKGSELGFSLQKIEKVLQLQQSLHQLKEDRIRQEQRGSGIQRESRQLHGNLLQEKKFMEELNRSLGKTIKELLSPYRQDGTTPSDFEKQAKKKKKRLHI